MARAVRGLATAVFLLATLGPTHAQADGEPDPPASFAVYALSRGSGVPAEAQAVLAETRQLLDELQASGGELTVEEQRIGLEGETRLCAAFADPDGARAAQLEVEELAEGVPLLNVVAEPCEGDTR